LGGLSETESVQADLAGGEDGERLSRRMQSARERVMEQLDSPPPDVSTEDLQRAVERLARRVEETSAGQRPNDRGAGPIADPNPDRAQHRGDERPVAAASGGEDFDDILDRDDPRRPDPRRPDPRRPDPRRDERREPGYEARPAVGPDFPSDAGFEARPDMRPDTRPDTRQESLSVLDQLEARLDSLGDRVERSKGSRAVAADGAGAAGAAAGRDMSRQFLALEQRIDALREVTEANSVSAVREDLSRLGRQVDNLAHDRGDTSEAIDTVRAQLERLHATFQDRGEPESAALAAIEQRLAGLAGQVGQFELAPAALDAVERGYAHILERMVKIERMAEDAVPPEDLWDRIEAIRSQIERLPSRDSVSAMENRLLELADRIDATAAAGQDDDNHARLESQLEKIAYSLAEIGARKDAEGDDLNRRLGEVLKRLDRMEADGKSVDFTPIEVRLSDIASRLDTRLRGPADRAVAAIEKRLEGLARAFDDQLDLTAAGLAPLERKLDGLTGLIRDIEMTARGPDMGVFEQRLDDLQARLGEIGIEIRRSGGPDMQRRLDELAVRLDAFQGGETHVDMQPVTERLDHLAGQINMQPVAERLDHLAEQINAIQPGAAPDLNPIQTRLDELAAAIIETGEDDGENPVAVQLAEISALLNANRDNDFDAARVTALLEKLESAFDRGEEPDFIALADRMAKLNETLESAADLASLEDISDLRSEIATLRRELRSLSATSGEDNEITPILKDLAERIDKLPSEAPATHRDLEDQMGRILLAIEQSAGQDTAISQIGETLTAIQATLDETVRYGGLASEEALGDGQGANLLMQLGRALREDLGALRSQAAEAERRTQDSINALGGALVGVTGRMAVLETGEVAPAMMQPGEPAVAPQAPIAATAFEPDPAEFAAPELPEMAEPQIPAAEIPQADTAAAMADETEAAASPMFDPEPEPVAWSGEEAAAYDEPQASEPEPKPAMTAPVLETDEDDAPVTSSIEQDVAAQQTAAQQQRSETASLIAAIRGIEPQRSSETDDNRAAEAMAGPSEFAAQDTPAMSEPELAEPELAEPEVAEPEMAEPAAAAEHEPEGEITVGAATLPDVMPEAVPETVPDADAGAGEPALTGTLDVTPEPQDAIAVAEPQPAEPAEKQSAGGQGFLGRLTSSQLLKRATGGKSESFTPGLDEDDDPDALLEPGTDGPMMSELDGAPSSDTAVMSGERSDDAASPQAGAASIADSPPGAGFILADEADGGDKVNDFLAAARRAARAAVIEAAEAERYAEENKPDNPLNRIITALNAQRKIILAGAVVLAVAFAAWQFLESRDGVVVPQMAQVPQEAAAPATPAMAPAETASESAAGTAQAPAGMDNEPAAAEPTSEMTFADPTVQPDQFRSREAGAASPSPGLAPPPVTTPSATPAAPDMDALRADAEKGVRDAQFNAGLAYARGLGVKQDYVEAYKWFDLAARSGDPQAGARRDALAKVMTPGDVGKAGAAASAWFIASAQDGVRDNQFNAGLAYARGLGVKQDYVEAYKWFDLAARAGDPQAGARRDALAKVMTPGDLDKARVAALAALGLAPLEPIANSASQPGPDRSEEPAAPAIDLSLVPAAIGSDELRAAAITGNHHAEFEVATRYADGRGVGQDFEQAVFWYMRAAEGGLAPAQYRLASIYEKGTGVRRNPRSAQDWYRRAANAGNAKAMHNLAVLFAEGAAGKPDLAAAGAWFKKAAERGVRDSQFNAGILYARGLGVKQDYIEAYKWFAIAAHSGDEQAKARREAIAQAMSAERLAQGRLAVEAFKPTPLDPAANLVPPPDADWGEPVAAGEPGKVSLNSPNLIGQAQAQLARLGFDPGPADGKLGPKTRLAVEAFQAAAGLDVTGRIDAALVQTLQNRRI
jgi:TPR repeat protein